MTLTRLPLCLACVLTLFGTLSMYAQGSPDRKPKSTAQAWKAPRTAWGHPDLQGTYRPLADMPFQRPLSLKGREFLTDEEIAAKEKDLKAEVAELLEEPGLAVENDLAAHPSYADPHAIIVSRRSSAIVDPANGRLPAWTDAQVARIEAKIAASRGRGESDSWEDRSLSERCISSIGDDVSGYGRGTSATQILQTPEYVAILMSLGRHGTYFQYRIVPLDGRPKRDSNIQTWRGDARGRWEGDTLVVEIGNINDRQDGGRFRGPRLAYPGSGQAMRVTERFRRTGPNAIEYRVTVEDPQTFTKPYTVLYEMTRDEAFLMMPGNCHEGNEGMTGVLAGARAAEVDSLDSAARHENELKETLKALKAEWAQRAAGSEGR